jgi:poly(A) polymerase
MGSRLGVRELLGNGLRALSRYTGKALTVFVVQSLVALACMLAIAMQFKDAPQMRKATLRRMLMRETFPLELELHRLDCLGSHRRLDIYDFLREQRAHLNDQPHLHPPLLNGNDVIALGARPGPELGALLHELRDKQLAEELTTPEAARDWVKSRLSEDGRPARAE